MTVIVSIAGKHGTEAVAYNFLFILFYFLCDRLSSCPGTHYVVDKAVLIFTELCLLLPPKR